MYTPDPARYDGVDYARCGAAGLRLPRISLGLWQNFGGVDVFETGRAVIRRAFDRGVTHFDLANNYGPPYGSAEETFGRILAADFSRHRDEMVISTKAGWDMWPGPYGNGGSRKHIIASLDQSLRRLELDYVDILYSHRPTEDTPLEETMGALAHAVHQGKALYAGISAYDPERTRAARAILAAEGVPLLIHQPSYSMLNRTIEAGLLATLAELGMGCIVFSPLSQGLLTSKYLRGVPADSRAARRTSLDAGQISVAMLDRLGKLAAIAAARGQSLAQMAVAWTLRDPIVTSALVGARTLAQLDELLNATANTVFSDLELGEIDALTQEA